MLVAVLLFAGLVAFASLPALWYAKKHGFLMWSDSAIVPASILLWLVLTSAGVGHQGLSHIVELPIVGLITLVMLYLRVATWRSFSKYPQEKVSMAVLVISFLVPIIVRMAMPYIPE